MRQLIANYCSHVVAGMGSAWNRFWYTPADALPLSLLRIGTGAIALFLHATLSPDLVAFFGRGGLLDKAEIAELRPAVTQWLCFLDYLQSPGELWFGHVVAGLVLLLFTVGFYSRVTSILALYVVLSYLHRGPMIASQAEVILAMMMFYLCLGPCGRCLSVDAWLAKRRGQPGSTIAASSSPASWGANAALRLLQVHVSLVYLMMAVAKIKGGDYGPVWWSGDAMWFLIAKPESRLVDLTFLHAHPFIVNLWSHAVVAFELTFGLLIWHRLWRPALLVASVPMWIMMALVTGAMPLCLLLILAGVAFIPGETLRACFARQPAEQSAATTLPPDIERRATISTR